ncbi:hypothetical protein ACWDYK_39500 [Streptomyces anthocyanicus]|uniref:hypothetical protein n=1 Tax=Streptomyces anthocyanicus TaxID=68174 RepID=UPI003864EF39
MRRAAERFQVSRTTAARWASRYRQLRGAGHARPLQPPAPQPAPDICGPRTAGRTATETPHRTRAAGRPHRRRRVQRPPHPRPARSARPGRLRQGHREPVRRATSERGPVNWSTEVRPDPRRRRPQGPRPGSLY